ncbi:hypothetical protein SAMN04489742_0572 [Arthrobacter crystallopoietes]|uniref:Uncharacterized protein n=1 Tax=Crystallibacter crystallopoietes TaxID=37928 RepID=A0A1H0ZUC1_9MICC|nr:hypothetical protein [Arthrobacter sp. VKM Ac-2550]SDQ31075.1 hypothetical protein SAMN04489742_0572 [Arthrobacter crystallopoietes]
MEAELWQILLVLAVGGTALVLLFRSLLRSGTWWR